jgi:hypothetical protein
VTPRKCRPAKARKPSRYAEMRALWEAAHVAEQRAYRPLPKGVRFSELIEGLRRLAEASGDDPVLVAALAKLEAFRRSEKAEAKTYQTTYLPRMETLIRPTPIRPGMSVREAAAEVAVAWWIPGLSFDAVTKRLEREYRKRTRP